MHQAIYVLRLLLVAALSHGLLWSLAPSARAESSASAAVAAEPAGYKALIESAVTEFDHANYVEAREQFGRAHGLYPNARTLRGLGMVEFELRNYVEALGYLEQALGSQIKALSGPLRTEAEQLLIRVRAYVGTLELEVRPATAEISLDGFPIELHRGPLRLAVGDHVLELRAEGYLSERRAIKMRGEQVVRLAVQLTAPPQAPIDPRAADREPQQAPKPVYKSWWLWTTVGVVAVGGAIAAVLLTRDKKTDEVPVLTNNTPPGATIEPLRGSW